MQARVVGCPARNAAPRRGREAGSASSMDQACFLVAIFVVHGVEPVVPAPSAIGAPKHAAADRALASAIALLRARRHARPDCVPSPPPRQPGSVPVPRCQRWAVSRGYRRRVVCRWVHGAGRSAAVHGAGRRNRGACVACGIVNVPQRPLAHVASKRRGCGGGRVQAWGVNGGLLRRGERQPRGQPSRARDAGSVPSAGGQRGAPPRQGAQRRKMVGWRQGAGGSPSRGAAEVDRWMVGRGARPVSPVR